MLSSPGTPSGVRPQEQGSDANAEVSKVSKVTLFEVEEGGGKGSGDRNTAGDRNTVRAGAEMLRRPSLKRMATDMGRKSVRKGLERASTFKEVAKKNPRKCGAGVMACVIGAIIISVVSAGAGVAVALAIAGGRSARLVAFNGGARTASVAGAAMGSAGKQSLVPNIDDEETQASRRRFRRMLEAGSGSEEEVVQEGVTLAKCPRDSQAIIEMEATPTSVYDGTSIFTTIDMINCLMALTKPSNFLTINRGAYTATINENGCKATSQSADQNSGSSSGLGSGGGGGSGSGSDGGGGGETISLKTFGVNSTSPTPENPEQPFSVDLVMKIKINQGESSSSYSSSTTPGPGNDPNAGAGASDEDDSHLVCFSFTGFRFDNETNKFTDYEVIFASCNAAEYPEEEGSSYAYGFEILGAVRARNSHSLSLFPFPRLVSLFLIHTLAFDACD